jgi:hypothetical protein
MLQILGVPLEGGRYDIARSIFVGRGLRVVMLVDEMGLSTSERWDEGLQKVVFGAKEFWRMRFDGV